MSSWNDMRSEAEDDTVPTRDLKDAHPELYGALLAANERIDRSGGNVAWVFLALFVLTILTIVGEWVPEIFGAPIQNLQSWWIYILLAFFFFITCDWLQGKRKRAAWLRCRDGIEAEMARARVSPNRLMAYIEGKDSLDDVAPEIKADADFDQRRR